MVIVRLALLTDSERQFTITIVTACLLACNKGVGLDVFAHSPARSTRTVFRPRKPTLQSRFFLWVLKRW